MLTTESDTFPDTATLLNDQLGEVRLKGVNDYFRSKVSLEVVQLAIECVDESAECYMAAGRSLSADYLLFARIERVKPQRRYLNVAITLFDVEGGNVVASVDKEWRNEKKAQKELSALVRKLLAETPEALEGSTTEAQQ